MLDVKFHPRNLLFQSLNIILSLFRVELQDSFHLDLQQELYIVIRHRTNQFWQERFQAFPHVNHHLINRLALLEFFILVNTFFNKYLFQR